MEHGPAGRTAVRNITLHQAIFTVNHPALLGRELSNAWFFETPEQAIGMLLRHQTLVRVQTHEAVQLEEGDRISAVLGDYRTDTDGIDRLVSERPVSGTVATDGLVTWIRTDDGRMINAAGGRVVGGVCNVLTGVTVNQEAG